MRRNNNQADGRNGRARRSPTQMRGQPPRREAPACPFFFSLLSSGTEVPAIAVGARVVTTNVEAKERPVKHRHRSAVPAPQPWTVSACVSIYLQHTAADIQGLEEELGGKARPDLIGRLSRNLVYARMCGLSVWMSTAMSCMQRAMCLTFCSLYCVVTSMLLEDSKTIQEKHERGT